MFKFKNEKGDKDTLSPFHFQLKNKIIYLLFRKDWL